MQYNIDMQNAIAKAAELAALLDVSDERSDYEQVADTFVAITTGFAANSDDFASARSDFDYLLEQAL